MEIKGVKGIKGPTGDRGELHRYRLLLLGSTS
jgi:hypothetical protein